MKPKRADKDSRATLVTLQQASKESGIPYNSVRDLVVNGHLRRVHIGDSRRIWIRRDEFERLIAEQ